MDWRWPRTTATQGDRLEPPLFDLVKRVEKSG